MQSNAAVTSFTAFAYWFDMAIGHDIGVYPANLTAWEQQTGNFLMNRCLRSLGRNAAQRSTYSTRSTATVACAAMLNSTDRSMCNTCPRTSLLLI
jgi:hypothetical protein